MIKRQNNEESPFAPPGDETALARLSQLKGLAADKWFKISEGVLKVSTTNGGYWRVPWWRRSGGVEAGHALVAEVIADVIAEKAALRFCTEKSLIMGVRELEVAIDIAGVAESEIEYLI